MKLAHRLSSVISVGALAAAGLVAAPAQAVAPDVAITSGPGDFTNSSVVTFGFSSSDPFASFECAWDTEPWESCAVTSTATLGDGLHQFQVRASSAGEAGVAAVKLFTVDTIAPDTQITATPGSSIPEGGTASYRFSANEAGATFQCRWDSRAWGSCQATTRLNSGLHRFEVRAVDRAGNVDPTPASHLLSVGKTGGGSGGRGIIQVRAQGVLGSILGVDVDPNNRRRDYKIVIEKRVNNRWKAIRTDRTRGVQDVRAIDLPRGVYRVRVPAQLGLRGNVSGRVRLAR